MNTNQFGEIVLYCAVWCPHSQKMLPEWNRFEDYAKVNFKKLDVSCVNNDNRGIALQKNIIAYPTIMLYRVDKTIEFNESRTVESLIEFIKKNGYNQFEEMQEMGKMQEMEKIKSNLDISNAETSIDSDIEINICI